jgi:PAS domain S-box-containing protein
MSQQPTPPGQLSGPISSCSDPAQRTETEQALRENEEWLRLALEAGKFGTFYYDFATGKLVGTARYKEHFGLPPDSTPTNEELAARIHPDDLQRAQTEFERCVAERCRLNVEYRVAGPGEPWRWLCAIGQATYDEQGRPQRFIGVNMDITERKQAEQALRESERQFRELADAMPQIVYVMSAAGPIEFINRQWQAYTGVTTADAPDLSRVIPAEDLANLMSGWSAARKAERPFTGEFRLKRASDGAYRWFLTRSVPIRDEQGRVVRWYGTSTDIDDQKRAEEALRQADQKKDEFLATLAHELRNPLAPLRNGLQIMRHAPDNAVAVEQARAIMERQLTQMVRLIDDLLDISRISRGRLELRKERIDLGTIVRSAAETTQPTIDRAGHQLNIRVPAEPIFVNADPTRLAQVFTNLLDNAAKYTEYGGRITVTIEPVSQEHQPPAEALVTVTDTGIGIPPAMLPNIFEMFTRVDQSLERSRGGLGIGLSLVKRLVEMHGGTATAQSEGPGQGSQFIVRLPVLVDKPKAEPPPLREMVSLTARRILVVDDVRDSAVSLATLLRLAGNETRTAHDGVEALEQAAAYRPDVILLDIGMPKMNGYDACRAIRQQPWGKDIVIVALTGWGQEVDRRRSKEAGFNGHLVKPVDHAALNEILRRAKSAAG